MIDISVLGVAYPVPSNASDTNWAAKQVAFEQALAAAVNGSATDIEELTEQLVALQAPTFTAVTPINGWANTGGGAFLLASSKVGRTVNVRGRIQDGVEGSVCGQLPVGMRPTATVPAIARLTNGVFLCQLDVTSSGDITVGSQIDPGGGDVGDGIAFDFSFSIAPNPT